MLDILKKFFGDATTAVSGSGGSVVGIDIGTSAIKIVELKKRGGKATLETYGAIALGTYAETDIGRVTNLTTEKVIEALKEVLKQAATSSKSVALAIPVQSSLIFTLELPTQFKESELNAVIQTEARKHIPVPITEVSLDYFILPKRELSFEEENAPDGPVKPKENMEVLAVAIQNDAISKLKSVASNTELSASFFEVEIFASVRSNLEHELSPVLLIDFGASRTKLSFVEFGMVKGYHTINRGAADITDSIAKSMSLDFSEAESMKKEYGLYENPKEPKLAQVIRVHTDYIFAETNNVLLAYEKKHNRTISKVIFTGGGSLLKGIKEIAEANFRAEIHIGHPFSKVGAPAFLEKVLDTAGPEFAVAIGLALRELQ